MRSLCAGFWAVNTIAICFNSLQRACIKPRSEQSEEFGQCGLPYGLCASLPALVRGGCMLQLFRSAYASS